MLKKSDMHPYQNRGVTEFYETEFRQGIVPMGGGKTVMALTAIEELIAAREIRCGLGFAPKRVAEKVWPAEVGEWEHLQGLRVSVVSGTAQQRLTALSVDADYYSVGVDNMQWMIDILKELPPTHKFFDLVNFDEISRFKNPASKRLRAAMPQRKHFKMAWGLTGTPAPNGIQDQFGPVKWLSNGAVWGKSFWNWRKENFFPTDYQQRNWEVRGEDVERRLWDDVRRISFTVDPKELDQVPAIPLITWVDMPAKVRPMYERMQKELIALVQSGGILAISQAAATQKCEQIAQGFIYGNDGKVAEWLHRVKMDALQDMVEAANGEPVMVTYRFRADLEALLKEFPGAPYLGAGVDGQLANTYIDNWNLRRYPIMFIHPASAGHGLNLQKGGSQMIHYSLGWSAEEYDQVVKRLARPGQVEQHVNNHHILMRETVDVLKYARVVKKMSAQQAFIEYMEHV